ncbi:MFS transporter [Haloplanus sp. GCM10025708]|uniref:MFS transporter n=1 Tax=Haloferacaceae TaxID=1644056 RepID=UPI0036093955
MVAPRLADVRSQVRALDVLALTALLWFLAKFLRYALPPLFETFRGDYGVSNTQLGLLFTGLMLGYGLMQFPSGALADRVGTVRVITGGAVVAAVAALLLFVSTGFPGLVAAVVLVGIGTGAHKTVAITLLTSVYAEHPGRALGAMDTVGELGGVVAPAVVVAVLSAAVDWEYVFLAAAVVALATAAAFRARVASKIEGTEAETDTEESPESTAYAAAFAEPKFLAFVAVAVLVSFTQNGITAFLPLYLTAKAGLSTSAAGLLYSVFFAVSVVQMATGELADRFGRLRIVALTLALAAASLGALLVAAEWAVLAGLVATLGVGMHGTRPGRDAHLVASIPDDVAGGTLGIVRTAMLLAGGVAPALVGYLSDIADFVVAFGTLAAAVVVALVLVILLLVGE